MWTSPVWCLWSLVWEHICACWCGHRLRDLDSWFLSPPSRTPWCFMVTVIPDEFGVGAAVLALISTVCWFWLSCFFWLKNCSLAGGGEKQGESRCCSEQGGDMQALQFLSFLCKGFSSPDVRTKVASGPGSPHLNAFSLGLCHACVQDCCSLIRLY